MDERLRIRAQSTELGAEPGFTVDYFVKMKMVSTRDIHIRRKFSKKSGKQIELKTRLLEAFFSEWKNISDRHILIQKNSKRWPEC